jgi:hypothetical protein
MVYSVSCLGHGFGDQQIVVRFQIKTDFSLLRSLQTGLRTEQSRVVRAGAYDNSSPSSAEFMTGWICTSPQPIRLQDVNWDNVIATQHTDCKSNLTPSHSIPVSSNTHYNISFLPTVRYSTWFPYRNSVYISPLRHYVLYVPTQKHS